MQNQDLSVPLDWNKKTMPEQLTNGCKQILYQALEDGWREVKGTIILDANDQVVGFRMAFVKPDGQHKEVVVPAAPELSEKYESGPITYFDNDEVEAVELPERKNPWAK